MTKQSFQLDPEVSGVSQAELDEHIAEYNTHDHNYDKMTGCAKMGICGPLTYTPNQTGNPNVS